MPGWLRPRGQGPVRPVGPVDVRAVCGAAPAGDATDGVAGLPRAEWFGQAVGGAG